MYAQDTLLIALAVGLISVLLLSVINIGWWLWVRAVLHNLKKPVSLEVLSVEERQKLKKQAQTQYEASLVRELKRFEGQLEALSNTLLTDLKQDVQAGDHSITQATQALTEQVTKQYNALFTQASSQMKTHVAAVDQTLNEQTATLAKSLAAITEERKRVVVARVEADLADILSQYLNASLGSLDLTGQEQLILERLEAIKPKLKEDINHVG